MFGVAEKSSKKLRLIDSIHRLGLTHHFEDEMNKILEDMQKPHNPNDDEDLYVTAFRFRLLRQQGYYVSCGKSLN